jgi:HIRAN domain-containing protein
MSSVQPGYDEFHTPVLGTVFGRRTEVVHRLQAGDRLILVPDPPGTNPQDVWVHARGGDVIGHLPEDVSCWLAPAMLDGSCYSAEVVEVRGDDVASWKRLLITVRSVRAVKSA